MPKHQIKNWVRTTTAGVANAARFEVWKENDDLADGIEWLSTLDTRTSNICKVLDGKRWNWEFEPIGHGHNYPGPIAHFQCRSTQIPILKSWEELAGNKELGRKLDSKEKLSDFRESVDGPVWGQLKYEQWLSTQPKNIQIAALGPKRQELCSAGKIGLDDLTTTVNTPKRLEDFADDLAKKRTADPRLNPFGEGELVDHAENIAFEASNAVYGAEIDDAMLLYHADAGAEAMNDVMRGITNFGDDLYVDQRLNAWLSRWDDVAHVNQKDMAVFRGMQIEDLAGKNWKPGYIIKDDAFWSTSFKREIAEEFASIQKLRDGQTVAGHRVIFDIEVPKGHGSFFSMEAASEGMYTAEAELVFRPGSALEILEVTTQILHGEPTTIIRCRLLPPQKSKWIKAKK